MIRIEDVLCIYVLRIDSISLPVAMGLEWWELRDEVGFSSDPGFLVSYSPF
jgi:hypothetical protein